MHTSDILTIAQAIVPDRTSMIFDGASISYTRLSERANQLANALAGVGVKKGDRIALILSLIHI